MKLFVRMCQASGLVIMFAVMSPSVSIAPAIAKTVRVPPPGAPNQDNATLNLMDTIRALRKRGFTREARDIERLLRRGRVFYRTTGKHAYDAQFIHSTVKGVGKDTLYFGVQHVKYQKGKGAVRYGPGDGRRRALTILVALHEMVHLQQGRLSVASGTMLKGKRGYALHEIEAYRKSMKDFARVWVIGDLKRYLDARNSMSDAAKYKALAALRHQLWALRNSITGPVRDGDKACRWTAITRATAKLRDDLDALWLDLDSKRTCRPLLPAGDARKQFLIEHRLKGRTLRARLKDISRQRRTHMNRANALRKSRKTWARRLTLAKTQSQRLKIAARIQKIDSALQRRQKLVADLTRERSLKRAELKRHDARAAGPKKAYLAVRRKYDQCRLAHVQKMRTQFKLRPSQLPPDMAVDKTGKLKLLRGNKRRKIDLDVSRRAIRKLFNYDARLLSVADAARARDPRTPCPKAPPAASNKKPAKARKTKCRGGGLTGRMNCVAKKIGGGR